MDVPSKCTIVRKWVGQRTLQRWPEGIGPKIQNHKQHVGVARNRVASTVANVGKTVFRIRKVLCKSVNLYFVRKSQSVSVKLCLLIPNPIPSVPSVCNCLCVTNYKNGVLELAKYINAVQEQLLPRPAESKSTWRLAQREIMLSG